MVTWSHAFAKRYQEDLGTVLTDVPVGFAIAACN